MKPKKSYRQKPDSGKKRLKVNLQSRPNRTPDSRGRQEFPSDETDTGFDEEFDERDDAPVRANPIEGRAKGVRPLGKAAAMRASETAPIRKAEQAASAVAFPPSWTWFFDDCLPK